MKKLFYILIFIFSVTFLLNCENKKEKNTTNLKKTEDYKQVKSAILDYVEALYLVDSTKIERSVDTKMRKIGFYLNPDDNTYRDNLEMSYSQLVGLAARWNSDYNQANKNSPKKIEIFDVNSKTASAKLTAAWGIDLFHLAKVNNQWKIVNVMWQSMPKN